MIWFWLSGERYGVVGDFEEHLVWLPEGHRRLFAFLGSSIGNLTGDQRAGFLSALHGLLDPGEALLLGPGPAIEALDDTADGER